MMDIIENQTETKKLLAHLYNDISIDLFGVGTTLLKVSFLESESLITMQARHKKAPRSNALEEAAPELKQQVDFRLSQLYKQRMKQRLEEDFHWEIESLFRDYDGPTQTAFTNIKLR
ncbi:DUF2294 domain-containing protein [Sinobaca sp. H24]|uniref:DUF2294 domain-containing protein n=1 Tax=Sinobaca sp. H24 TaxID=2923376 RepID=UPI0027E2B912|nr:DUF2294 domain-containing protein [Sinobaca sp. H24]